MPTRPSLLLVLLGAGFVPALPLAAQEGGSGLVVTDSGLERVALGAEIRGRMEVRDQAGPVTGAPSTNTNTLRARVNLEAVLDEYLEGYISLQEAVSGAGTPSAGALYQAWFQANEVFGSLTVRGGRLPLDFGEGRMVSGDDWRLFPRVFDGATVSGSYEILEFTAFYTQAVLGQGGFSTGTRFWGAYGSWDTGPDFSVDTYALFLRDAALAIEETTVGGRIYGQFSQGVDWSVEAASQGGSRGALDVAAWAAVAQAGYTLEGGHRLAAEWSFASGDGDPTDGDSETFAAPFAWDHRYHGIADVVAWSNLMDLALRYELTWNEQWSIHAAAHDFRRDSTVDAVYTLQGGAGVAGTTSKHIGNELDFFLVGQLTPNLAVQVGGAWFLAGNGIAANDDQLFGYAQVELRF